MSKTYVIADLHGRYDLLTLALQKIGAHAGLGVGGTVVTLGDYVDRGPSSRQVIERLMLGLSDGWNLVCLRGNHEEIMLQSIVMPMDPRWWMGNGGGATLISYGAKKGQDARDAYHLVPKDHLEWLASLPLMHIDEHRIYVHAGVDPDYPLHVQSEERMTWKIYRPGDTRGHGDFHVVHGHEQFADGPFTWDNRTDLDTFAWHTGRLVVGVFDDAVSGGPIDLIEVIGEPDPSSQEAA